MMRLLVLSPTALIAFTAASLAQELPKNVVATVRCVALTVPAVNRAVLDGYRPLLLVNGREAGRLSKPKGPCSAGKDSVVKVESLSFVKPGHAERAFGAKGRDGVVQITVQMSARTKP